MLAASILHLDSIACPMALSRCRGLDNTGWQRDMHMITPVPKRWPFGLVATLEIASSLPLRDNMQLAGLVESGGVLCALENCDHVSAIRWT